LHFSDFNKKGLAIWRSEFSSSKIKITNTAKSIGLYIFFLTALSKKEGIKSVVIFGTEEFP